jgi:Flp pilus assembly protein TadD
MQALIAALEARGMSPPSTPRSRAHGPRTFHDRQGNCLSFTMLFVRARARRGFAGELSERRGAAVVVERRPGRRREPREHGGDHGRGEETIVDFNVRPYLSDHRSRRVSDSYALGLFYTNLGAEAILRDDHAAALVYLREAARVRPDIAGVWINLGVLYARHGRYEHAEAAYLRALDVDDDEPSAMTNLALVYQALGEAELAAEYRDRVQGYRERNPYYHFASATQAYEEQQFEAALGSLRRALRLKPDEHQFYELRGQVQEALGKSRDATQSSSARAPTRS